MEDCPKSHKMFEKLMLRTATQYNMKRGKEGQALEIEVQRNF